MICKPLSTPTLLAVILVAASACPQRSEALLVTLDLTADSGVETPGEVLEDGPFTVNGLTITASTGFNALTNNAGIGSGGEIDLGESLTLTFTGASFDLVSIDMSGVGSSEGGDAAVIDVDGTVFSLETGVTDFNGSSDLWSPSPPISLASGSTVTFTAENAYGLQAISLNIVAIPEPTAALFGSLLAVGLGLTVGRRRLSED